MRVLLAVLDSDYDNSLALDYLVAYARRDQCLRDRVEFCQIIASGADESTFAKALMEEWDVVGFNTYVWNLAANLAMAAKFKAANPRARIVLGGMEASYTAADLLRTHAFVDFVVLGEGEIVFSDLLQRLLAREKITGIVPGLAYRGPFGPISGGHGPIVPALDEIPSPFASTQFAARSGKKLLYESYRGCAFKCGFCLYHRDYTQRRVFSLDRVKSDLAAIGRSGCTHLRFVDSTFNLDRNRAKAILRVLAEMDMEVSVEVSAEFFDAEMIGMLAPAGIRQVDIGLQSTNEAALTTVNRTWYKEGRFRDNLRLLRREEGLTLNVELIAGLPSDDYQGLKHSIDHAIGLWPDHVSVYRLLGLRGTDVERRKHELGLEFAETAPYEVVASPGFSKEELDGIDLLAFAHLMLFNLGIGRYAMRYVMENTGIAPTDLYEHFLKFAIRERALYSKDEATLLGRHYAHGNRFDRDLPEGLAPERVLAALGAFFSSACCAWRACNRGVISQLLDYGYSLAKLDGLENVTVCRHSPSERLRLAPWCDIRTYSADTFRELQRQRDVPGPLEHPEVASVIFFIHPDFGPTAVAVTEGITDLVDRATSAAFLSQPPAALAREEAEALHQLQALHILIPATNAAPPHSRLLAS